MSATVRLAPSKREFAVEENESILDAALRQGVMLPYSCRGGSCGACEGRVLEGEVVYPNGLPDALPQAKADAGVLLCCQARAASESLLLEMRELGASEAVAPRVLPARLAKKTRLAPDVMQLDLQLPPNQRLQFRAGQYLDLLLPGGKRRSFSMANPPERDDVLQLQVREVPGGFFSGQLDGLREKSVLRIEGPHGHFWLRHELKRPAIFVGGGTGYAPLRAMLLQAFDAGLQRPMHLFWGVRGEADLYSKEAEVWAAQWTQFRFTPVLSEPPMDWAGKTGWVHQAVLAQYPSLEGFDVYMAGPPPMIEAAKTDFLAAGLEAERLYFDSFEYAAAGVTGSSN